MSIALETVVKQLTDSGIIAPGKLENFVPPKASPKDGEELLRVFWFSVNWNAAGLALAGDGVNIAGSRRG